MGNKDAKREARRARQQEEKRQAQIRQGQDSISSIFGQFDDDFYEGRKKAFVDFARPDLDEQADDAREQLTFSLARRGALDGSSRVAGFADIDETYQKGLQDIESKGLDYARDARDQVENARADLVSSLQVTGDAAGAAQAANNRARALAMPDTYSPISQLFTDAAAGFAQQAALEKAYSAGYGDKPRFNTGLFGTPRQAVTTRT